MKSISQVSPQTASTSSSEIPPPSSDDLNNNINSSNNANNVGHEDGDTLSPEKQLLKLKRFFKTIYQFSQDLPTCQRDKVKDLILNLISSLPLLRKEYGTASKENVESALFGELQESTVTHGNTSNNNPIGVNNNNANIGNQPTTNSELRLSYSKETLTRKRRHGFSSETSAISPKRLASQSTYPNLTSSVSNTNQSISPRFERFLSGNNNSLMNGNLSPGGANGTASLLARPDLISNGVRNVDFWSTQNEEWRNVETLFSTMVATMERLRYAMLLFQQRAKLAQLWSEKFQLQQQRQQDSNLKIEEVKRKADAAVHEVKLAALTELQKAVLTAEQKALQMIAAERVQMEKLLRDTQHQENSIDNCWNCGRKAGQTCSGCGLARYCGVFCQHKDWSSHRNTCGANPSHNDDNKSSLKIKTEPSPNSSSLSKERPSPKSV